jgi:Actinobacteria/chloroflexi VLRF1 release factor
VAAGRPAAGGGRWIDVAPERLMAWLDGFAERHGQVTVTGTPEGVEAVAADGAVARVLAWLPPPGGFPPGGTAAGLALHAGEGRVVGVLLVRRGGHAAGVFRGPELVASKVGSVYVQSRAKAGGWSQQRFARRRANQAGNAVREASAAAARVLLPHAAALEAVLLGGDRGMAAAALGEPALAPLRALVTEPFLTTGDPRLAVLKATPKQFRALRVHLTEGHEVPPPGGGVSGC